MTSLTSAQVGVVVQGVEEGEGEDVAAVGGGGVTIADDVASDG